MHEDTLWDEDALNLELKSMFEGTDLAEHFGDTLDLVIDVDLLMDQAPGVDVSDVGLDDTPEPKPEVPAEEAKEDDWYSGKCPYCGTHVRMDDIIG